MRELRTDPTTGDLVVLSTDRVGRPRHLLPGRAQDLGPDACPFCAGHEHQTPPTLHEYPGPAGWQARAFANRFPALGTEGPFERRGHGPYGRISGIGAHEVIVEGRDHGRAPWTEPEGVAPALFLARDRMRDLAQDARFEAIQHFRNVGAEAGATLAHPHAQVLALPEVPPLVARMTDRAERHWNEHRRELIQDLIDADLDEGKRVLFETGRIVAVCPYAPRVAFEIWLLPTVPGRSFLDTDDGLVRDLARATHRVMGMLDRALEAPPHNAVMYTAPLRRSADGFRWHVRILPRLAGFAGFEVGSGAYLHGVPPEEAARVLRG